MPARPFARNAPSRFGAWRPTRFEWLAMAGAFLLGLLLFLVATRGQRGDAPAVAPTAAAMPDFDPLPAPMPADADGASGMAEPGEDVSPAERPRLVEAPRPAPPPAPAAPPPTARAPAADAGAVPISSPAPNYPRRAMQRRETGTVRVQVQVGADGRPVDVSLLESSASRDLDRAALDAVRRWRFRPATREGQPVPATVVVPIAFRL